MSSFSNMEDHLEEQPVKKRRVENMEEKPKNAKPIEVDLPKTMEADKNKELKTSTTTMADLPPPANLHRKLPPELNCQIFYCISMPTRRKFILGLGWDFYAMFRQSLLIKSKRLCNPKGNKWHGFIKPITMSPDGSTVTNNNKTVMANVCAFKGFAISSEHSRADNFPGTILYYYEVKHFDHVRIGLSDGPISGLGYPYYVGYRPNTYAISSDYYYLFGCSIAGEQHNFTLPRGRNGPRKKNNGTDVYGCGLVINPEDKLAIFFTSNGTLIDRKIPINPSVDRLFPAVTLWSLTSSIEANFGDDKAKPFEYDIKNCPGMGLDCI